MYSLLPNSDWNWRKWGKPRLFRYDLNQIPYDYIVEVRNRFKGLDLTHRVPDVLCMKVHDIVQENSYFYLIRIGLIQSICVWSKVRILAYLWSLNIVSSYYGNYILWKKIVESSKAKKVDVVKVLHSIGQQIWKTQQWPWDWKRSVFIPIPKKGSAKECSNYCTNCTHLTL